MTMMIMKITLHQPKQQQQQRRQQPQPRRRPLQNIIHLLIWDNIVVLVDTIVVVYMLKNIVNEISVSVKQIFFFSYLFKTIYLAIHARVTNRYDAGQWVSYLLTIVRVYKDRLNRIQESEQWVWVARKDVQCSCPRLKLDRQYLLMGFYDQMQTSLSLDRTSVVIEWRPRMEQRLNRFRRYELNKRC